jgi:predicted adenylyl cyclase CyaB
MREIEVKARVDNITDVLQALKEHSVLIGEPLKHHDVVYARPGATDNDPSENWLRIRTEDDRKSIFTLKRSVTGELDSIEHETEVADADELEKIISYLGYRLYSDLTKTRQKARIGDVEICLDNVDGLGIYIEAEKLVEDAADAALIQKELWQVLDKLGISRSSEETSGYDVLMRRKYGPPKQITDYIHTTLIFLIRNNQILLGLKKRGFGEGKLNGIGGKVEKDESVEAAMIRETKEEIGVTPTYFSKVGDLEFIEWFKDKKERVRTEVYLCEEWEGEPAESDEITPRWVSCDELPFKEMWPDDQFWLPQIIAGERVKANFEYDKDENLLKHNVTLVDSF